MKTPQPMHYLKTTVVGQNYPLCRGLAWAKAHSVFWSGTASSLEVDCKSCKAKLRREGRTVTP